MNWQYTLAIAILIVGAIASIMARKLTVAAAITGAVLGWLVFVGSGFTGIAMMTAFFVLGTLATSFKKQHKEQLHLSETNGTRRVASQVFANAGAAAICGLLVFVLPAYAFVFGLMIAAALSSATADTLSSEMGNVYGKKFYNVLSFKKDTKGLNGVVSFEGTAFGVAGSITIAGIYSVGFGFSVSTFFIIIIAGTAGNLFDSVLGASLERKQVLNNDAVNFSNTVVGAAAAYILFTIT